MSTIESFLKQQYINIETFRKNGMGVKTPVWFAQDDNSLYVRTGADSGKVKRIRNNPQVNIAPCTGNGSLLGEWIPAQAYEVLDNDLDLKVNQMLAKKYGLMKSLMEFFSKLQGRKYTLLVIHLPTD